MPAEIEEEHLLRQSLDARHVSFCNERSIEIERDRAVSRTCVRQEVLDAFLSVGQFDNLVRR